MIGNILYFVLSTFLILLVLWCVKFLPIMVALRKIPGPRPLPIIGNSHHLTTDTSKLLPLLMELKKKYGNLFKCIIGFQETLVIVADHKFLEVILGTTKELNKSHTYTFFHDWLGFGLLTSYAERWQKHRKIITPAFHFKITEQFLEIFQENEKTFRKKLENELHGRSFNCYKYVTLLTLDNIAESAMGLKLNAQEDSASEYVKCTRKMSKIVIMRQFNPFLGNPFLYKFSRTYADEKKSLKVLHSTTENIIKERKAKRLQKEVVANLEDEIGIKKKVAFLDLLLSSTVDGRPLTNTEIREEVDTFLFEGHDTTASAISFCLYCLSKYPEAQEKIVEEIKSNLSVDDPPTLNELQSMRYLDAFIKEVLRIYPTVPMIARSVCNDLEYDGVKYPNGTTLQIFIYAILRDEKYFPDPEKFDPERFLSDNDIHPYAYIPFSAGARNCIGQRYALIEVKSTIVDVLKHFEILDAPDCELKLSNEAVLISQTGVNIRIRKRIN